MTKTALYNSQPCGQQMNCTLAQLLCNLVKMTSSHPSTRLKTKCTENVFLILCWLYSPESRTSFWRSFMHKVNKSWRKQLLHTHMCLTTGRGDTSSRAVIKAPQLRLSLACRGGVECRFVTWGNIQRKKKLKRLSHNKAEGKNHTMKNARILFCALPTLALQKSSAGPYLRPGARRE